MKIDRIEWWEVHQFVHQERVNSPEYDDVHERWDLVPKFFVWPHSRHAGLRPARRRLP